MGLDMPTDENLHVVKSLFNRHLHCTLGKDVKVATEHDFYTAFAYTVRDFTMERWKDTQDHYYKTDPKVCVRACVRQCVCARLMPNLLLRAADSTLNAPRC
jgi:glucan phosphorylase